MSTTEKGNAFRDRIHSLLDLCPRFTNVKKEIQIGHQDVDIYYEEDTSTGTSRVACECKNYSTPLTRTDLEDIWKKYWPLTNGEQRLVDAVRVFAPLPLGANAQAYLKQSQLNFSTQDELELNIIDFRAYLRSIETQYRENLGSVYTRPTLDTGLDAESVITEWISGASDQPIAILAGYGMGKTSLALHLAAQLARARLRGGASRIPILIPLSEISSQQSMDGLLGRIFSAQNRIPNYYYGLFAELNRRGRFVIFLDGFDEMKHAMSVPDFKYNFSEIHSLVSTNTRVVLLGRPSAFISDSEEHHVLRGVQRIGDREIELPGAPEYRCLRLAQFTEKQAFEFIEQYLIQNGPRLKAIRGQSYDHGAALQRLAEVRGHDELRMLVQRPVQARMVADLVIDGRVEWRSFNRYELYEIFVQRIIHREMEKQVRRTLSFETRFEFHQRLAWWLWTRARVQSFRVSDLPRPLLGVLPEELGIDRDGLTRELLAGSLLDKKIGDSYHFPHRSFLEFLVARQIVTQEWTHNTLEDVAGALTPETVDFIEEAGRAETIASWREYLDAIQAQVSSAFLTLIGSQLNAISNAAFDESVPSDASPRRVCFEHLRRLAAGMAPSDRFNFLIRSLAALSKDESRIMVLVGMLLEAEKAEDPLRSAQIEQLTAAILSRCVGEFSRTLHAKHSKSRPEQRELLGLGVADPYVRAFVDAYEASPRGDELLLALDTGRLFDSLQSSLNKRWVVSDLPRPSSKPIAVRFANLRQWNKVLAMSSQGGLIVRFLQQYPHLQALVHVRNRT